MLIWPTGHVGMLHPTGNTKARQKFTDFMTFATASLSGVSYDMAKPMFHGRSTNQVETVKSLFEEVGLLYVPYRSNRIVLTDIGNQLYNVAQGDPSFLKNETVDRIVTLLVFALSHTQINRPQSLGVPRQDKIDIRACDVRPYATAWQAIHELGGVLYLNEFYGALNRVWNTADYAATIATIISARENKKLGISGQPPTQNYDIYWRSHLSVADSILIYSETEKSLRVRPEYGKVLKSVLTFGKGCSNSSLTFMRSRPWSTVEDYYSTIGGLACPPFLANGTPEVANIAGQVIANVGSYPISPEAGGVALVGGPELCSLQLKLQTFHPTQPKFLLRIDRKEILANGSVKLLLGQGRPISDLKSLQAAFGEEDDAKDS